MSLRHRAELLMRPFSWGVVAGGVLIAGHGVIDYRRRYALAAEAFGEANKYTWVDQGWFVWDLQTLTPWPMIGVGAGVVGIGVFLLSLRPPTTPRVMRRAAWWLVAIGLGVSVAATGWTWYYARRDIRLGFDPVDVLRFYFPWPVFALGLSTVAIGGLLLAIWRQEKPTRAEAS